MKKKIIYFSFVIIALLLGGCSSETKMQDGFYTAEMSEYSHGWKEYLCIMVKNDKIVYAEFNAKNPSGYIKAWDNAYMQSMNAVQGTYPNEYTREYVARLIESQSPEEVDIITGATTSGDNFLKLSAAVVEQAVAGNTEIATVQAQ
ncbi:FMN-binding protein [Anaerotignum faecicola]|nr:FMN-binding protein [Anaerotignum faecicola]